MDNTSEHITKVIHALIADFPDHKLAYIIQHPSLVSGIILNLSHYGVTYNQEVHDQLVEIVQDKLSGSPDIEYEWNDEQYENFVKYLGD